jgi:hypothetical protein
VLELLNTICEFRQQHPVVRGQGLKSNEPRLNTVKRVLFELEGALRENFSNYRGIEWTFTHSKGMGFFPAILHVSILPPGQKVSDGIYVVLCFDKYGRGFLAGCAESKTNPKGLNTIVRSRSGSLSIDVDGQRATTKYNDCFENPREFFYNDFTLQELLDHIAESLDSCINHLGLAADEPENSVKGILDFNILSDEPFDPANISEGRLKVSRQIALRRGQRDFRSRLLTAYDSRCAVTECGIVDILEAAHIVPYSGSETNHTSNGLLLRADIHTLFDLGLITIEPSNYTIMISEALVGTEYEVLHGKTIRMPGNQSDWPSVLALRYHQNHVFVG